MFERFNQTLLKMLGTLEEHQKHDWNKKGSKDQESIQSSTTPVPGYEISSFLPT